MPLRAYGVLVGAVVDKRAEAGDQTPHYQIQIKASGTDYRIAINVRSAQDPPDLLFLADEAFAHPVVANLVGLEDGFHLLPASPGGAALDFIRGNLFDRTLMRPLPSLLPGPDNDLSDRLDHFASRALADPEARVYAFGERWGPEQGTRDKVFGFRPGNGIHDIHMNQGNSGRFTGDNGVWQDGALLIHYPAQSQWVAFFLAFQSQSWHTDDQTGHARPDAGAAVDRRVQIVAAMVNPLGPAPEPETVTLLNSTPDGIDLSGWSIADRLKRRFPLPHQTLPAGATLQVPVQQPVALGNKGGLITLLDSQGVKVDGVAYTGQEAPEGWTVVF